MIRDEKNRSYRVVLSDHSFATHTDNTGKAKDARTHTNYIYIYIYRERERERDTCTLLSDRVGGRLNVATVAWLTLLCRTAGRAVHSATILCSQYNRSVMKVQCSLHSKLQPAQYT